MWGVDFLEPFVITFCEIRLEPFTKWHHDVNMTSVRPCRPVSETEFSSANLHVLVRIQFIIVVMRWTGLKPWEFEFRFPGSLASTFLEGGGHIEETVCTLSEIAGKGGVVVNLTVSVMVPSHLALLLAAVAFDDASSRSGARVKLNPLQVLAPTVVPHPQETVPT